MFQEYAAKWGDRYVTSNVKVYNDETKEYEYVGATHRYFKTNKGLRVMAFGLLFDFTGMCWNRPWMRLEEQLADNKPCRKLQRLSGHQGDRHGQGELVQ